MEDNRNNQDKLEINVPAELLEGVYSNLAVITHSSAEFILDFIRVMPGTSKAPVKSRVVMAPEHVKLCFMLFRTTYKNTNKSSEKSASPALPHK